MKVHVLKNKTGRVIATFEAGASVGSTLQPNVSKGHRLEEADLPRDYAARLDALYKKRASGKKTSG